MSEEQPEEPGGKKSEAVLKLHSERLKILKRAQEFSAAEDIPKAVEHYSQYLGVLSTYHNVPEEKLSPSLFDPKTDLAELLLISHVYWDLAKAYDRSPTLQMESVRCLGQFAKFTAGFKYQYANSQMVKKYVKRKMAHNPKAFSQAYEKIRIEAKGCFVATYCYGEASSITNDFRSFREVLLQNSLGIKFVHHYYNMSPSVTRFLSSNPIIGYPLKYLFFRPLLKLTHFIIKSYGSI